MYFAGEKLLYLISFCICPATSFASALNIFHLELSCQVVFVHFSLFPLYCTDPREGILDENEFFSSSSLYNKPSCSYHCAALMYSWVSPALSAATWTCFHTLTKEYNSGIGYSGGGSVYFQLFLRASWELSWLWECSASGRMGARRNTKGSVSVCAFPLSGHHKLCSSPRLNHGLTFNSDCEKVGDKLSLILTFAHFFTRVLFPPFITWGLQKSIRLCSINDFPKRKDILSAALEADKMVFLSSR